MKKAHIIWLSIPLTKIREDFSAKQPKSKTKIRFANAQVERKDSTANMCLYVFDSRLEKEKEIILKKGFMLKTFQIFHLL